MASDTVYVLAAAVIVVAQAVLIAALLIQNRRRRRAERELVESEAELRSSYERVRDVGGRLLTAQEAERSRIARELHDDISHQLALLEIELRLSGRDEEARVRINGIARSVHELSHRLHPAKLQLLGLIPSLRSLQKELLRSGLVVEFTHGDIPSPLSPSITLCVYRIVQEALQNAAKYSEAAAVSVDLRHDHGELTLTIADDGVGFDVDSAWGKGLGLISILERIEANRGTLDIRSRPGGGTRFRVRVPATLESDKSWPSEPAPRATRVDAISGMPEG